MSSRDEATLPATRPQKLRKSLSHLNSTDMTNKENVTTDISALMGTKEKGLGERQTKKSRSKSIGPGGLDALKDGTGNRRQSIAAPPPRSILKPTIAPLREIPAHVALRKPSPKKAAQSTTAEATAIKPPPFSLTQNAQLHSSEEKEMMSGTKGLETPFDLDINPAVAETRVMLRTEEEQQAAARERAMEVRLDGEEDTISRREARRKSLANRRVSFAPEATLHTWDVVEYLQDSTTSSASTNSTRRASSASIGTPRTPGQPNSDGSEPLDNSHEQLEDTLEVSPESQSDLNQKKRRRSSVIPPLDFNNPDDEIFSSSPSRASSDGDYDENVDEELPGGDDGLSESGSDSDNEGTAMSLDVADNTDMSIASAKSAASSTGSSLRLEEALRLAARQAGTQGIEFDEHGDLGLEEEQHIEVPIQAWSQDQENLNPFSPAFKNSFIHKADANETNDDGSEMEETQAIGKIMSPTRSDGEMTMDMTLAIGGIVTSGQPVPNQSKRKSIQVSRRQSTRQRSFGERSSFGDETMDLTMAMGEIKTALKPSLLSEQIEEDEEMTMEFTSVIQSNLEAGPLGTEHGTSPAFVTSASDVNRIFERDVLDDDGAMDMTVAVGGIIAFEDADLTTSLDPNIPLTNSITKSPLVSPIRSPARFDLGHGNSVNSLHRFQSNIITSETGSPSLAAFKGKGLRRSGGPGVSITPKSATKRAASATPVKNSSMSSQQKTSKSPQSTRSLRRASSQNIPSSPARQIVTTDIVQTPAPSIPREVGTPNRLFQKNASTGAATPHIVLTPQNRRLSGVGADQSGLGSPQVAAILDRRVSICDIPATFTIGETRDHVRFADPRTMNDELDKQLQDDWDREDGRKIMEREADLEQEVEDSKMEEDATINIKEMIESLTPKKKPLKGRKSLHVGAAKGILGKRPAELDEDEEDNDDNRDNIKRLKNLQASPVKNIKLQGPPSKAETTGRMTRATRRSLETLSGNVITPTLAISPSKPSTVASPKGQSRFKDVDSESNTHAFVPLIEKLPVEDPVVDNEENEDEPMHLQDFLNMTSIRFMELTTTKRRHTVAPNSLQQDQKNSENDVLEANNSLESCVVAGACTIPMLELFQHSCRELKKYISEGRKVVREIETDTFEENPALFREYIAATPDIRNLMDNQFKNVKTHARLLSKATWYEWRMKLLDGLKDGLHKTMEGMEGDAEVLHHQQDLLDSVLPSLLSEYESVAEEESKMQAAAEELASCDQVELSEARNKLISVEADVELKKAVIENLKIQLQEKETAIGVVSERKQACLDDIQEAEKIRELCRGWSADEGLAFKAKVDDLEKKYGWVITGTSGHQVSMTFRREVELVFDASSFKPNKLESKPLQPTASRVDLWYIAANRELDPLPLTTEKEFFLQNIREHCRGLSQGLTTVKSLLEAVSTPWSRALDIVNDINTLRTDCPVDVVKTSDTSIAIRSSLLLAPLRSKVDLEFNVHVHSSEDEFEICVEPSSSVSYGERFNELKMTEFLATKLAGDGEEKRSWGDIIYELELRLLARGRK